MASSGRSGRRNRGSVGFLPSGSARVRVYAGTDHVTGRPLYLRETIPAGATKAETQRAADKVLTRLLNQVDERRNPRTSATVGELLDRWLEVVEVERSTRAGYVSKIERHIRPALGAEQVARVRAETIETFYARLRRCRERCGGRGELQHRTTRQHVCDEHSARRKCSGTFACQWCRRACKPHQCTPLSTGTIRVIHTILSGLFTRAVRWEWVSVNPMKNMDPPPTPRPNPDPPSASEAAAILNAAWDDDEDWGVMVLFFMTTGARRGEVCGLRRPRLDLEHSVVTVATSTGQIGGAVWSKDIKTHQSRRIVLDAEMVEALREHGQRARARAAALGIELVRDAYVFSPSPDGSTPPKPDTITQRYSRLVSRLGIDTHLHELRHYSATELIAAGVDVRTVAGRLGHSGGGSTTLRAYAAFVSEADQRAATALATRRPRRSGSRS